MTDDSNTLTCTNGDLWLATEPHPVDGHRAPLPILLRVPTAAAEVRNGITLARLVQERMTDVHAARNVLLAQHCSTGETANIFIVTPAFTQALAVLMAEPVTLAGVHAIKMSAWSAGVFVAPDDVTRCGPLLTD